MAALSISSAIATVFLPVTDTSAPRPHLPPLSTFFFLFFFLVASPFRGISFPLNPVIQPFLFSFSLHLNRCLLEYKSITMPC